MIFFFEVGLLFRIQKSYQDRLNMGFSYWFHLNVHFIKSNESFNLQNQDFLQLSFSNSLDAASFLHSGTLIRGCEIPWMYSPRPLPFPLTSYLLSFALCSAVVF